MINPTQNPSQIMLDLTKSGAPKRALISPPRAPANSLSPKGGVRMPNEDRVQLNSEAKMPVELENLSFTIEA